ncbi:hypothetical protein [Saccharothrix luteola]|uniref:hypothetical protein n=1 Tax=Saccharothrix luteola TaxID=2893018 RepID=UPI001E2E55E6|nr:hypothetical protein [Saccharothrix luteola]MCC8249792.1 hypothetical protein [Saccharothrix luteola]
MLLRLAYLGMTNAFALLRLLPMSGRDKNVEILALRHQITILERQPGDARPPFSPGDRALLAALLHRLPVQALRRLRLLVRPETVLCRHRDLVARRHAAESRPERAGRPTDHGPSALFGSWCYVWRARPCLGLPPFVLAVIEHASRGIRVLDATPHPTAHPGLPKPPETSSWTSKTTADTRGS